MKNLQMFGSGDSWGRFLYKEGVSSYSPGNPVDDKGNITETAKVELKDGTGLIEDSECKKEVKVPWDTDSQNTLRDALAKEIKEGGTVNAIIAQKGNTLGQIAFGMEHGEKVSGIGWGTEVVYLDKDGTAVNRTPLAKANALKPGWEVRFWGGPDSKVSIEVTMTDATTKAQLVNLGEKITKNIDCDKKEKVVVVDDIEEEKEETDEEIVIQAVVNETEEVIEDKDDAFLNAFVEAMEKSGALRGNWDRIAALEENENRKNHENSFMKNGKVRVQGATFLPGHKVKIRYAVDGKPVTLKDWLTANDRPEMTEAEFHDFINSKAVIQKIQKRVNLKTNAAQLIGKEKASTQSGNAEDAGTLSAETDNEEQVVEEKKLTGKERRAARRAERKNRKNGTANVISAKDAKHFVSGTSKSIKIEK